MAAGLAAAAAAVDDGSSARRQQSKGRHLPKEEDVYVPAWDWGMFGGGLLLLGWQTDQVLVGWRT